MRGGHTTFEITGVRTLVVAGFKEPTIRAEAFDELKPDRVHCADDLVAMIDSCEPLTRHFRWLAWQHLKNHCTSEGFVDRLTKGQGVRSGAEHLILKALREDEEDGWQRWIEYSGDAALADFLAIVHDWLAAPVDWSEREHFNAIATAQEAALFYFYRLPQMIRKALGVDIVEGDCPGSSYEAAELVKDIELANQVAALLELDIVFQQKRRTGKGPSHG